MLELQGLSRRYGDVVALDGLQPEQGKPADLPKILGDHLVRI